MISPESCTHAGPCGEACRRLQRHLAEAAAYLPIPGPYSGTGGRAPSRPADAVSHAQAVTSLEAPQTAKGGTKADAGKLGTHLLPTRPLEAVARVLDFGARKYAPDNWRRGIAYTRVYGAVLRHLWAWWRGERADPETGLHPLAHAACELLFLLEYELSQDGERRARYDDRPELVRQDVGLADPSREGGQGQGA